MKYDVFGIGNALVDMEFKVKDNFFSDNKIEKSLMTLVEEERQMQLVDELHRLSAGEVKRQCGGSAANTIIAVSQFGGKSFYSFKVANDETGHFYLKDITDNGVDTKNTLGSLPEGNTGKCLVMVSDDAERTMNTYLGITASFDKEQLDEQSLKNSKWLYVEGYLVASPTGHEAALEAVRIAKQNNVKTALTLSDPSMVKFFKDNMIQIVGNGVDLIFCNEMEAMDFTGTNDLYDAREKLKDLAKTFVITLGKNGAIIWDGTMFIDIEPHQVKAVDTNGAGDMYAGAFLYGITNGMTYAGAGALASLASSKIVEKYGPRVDWTTAKDILKELK
ncbi:MAG: adenosine kinase [Halobacteriovoraceae bacterium]|jgi:sugar/nucleoside kinase (ribokinase family)|nr:adenosine kinase [Halobacteriovoraceae bacterium]